MTDSAINRLSASHAEAVRSGKDEKLAQLILTYLIVDGRIALSSVTDEQFYVTRNGQRISLRADLNRHVVNRKARIIDTVVCDDGIVYLVDDPVIPNLSNALEYLRSTDRHREFVRIVELAELEGLLEFHWNFTIFAPIDEAFAKLSKQDRARLTDPKQREDRERFLQSLVFTGRLYIDELPKSGALSKALSSTNDVERKLVRSGSGQAVTLDGARMGKVDVDTASGVVHELETMPSPLWRPVR